MDGLLSDPNAYTGTPRVIITLGYFGCFGCVGVCLSSLGPILLSLADILSATFDSLGFLFVVRSVGYLIGSVIGGYVVDRVRRTHVVLLVTMLLCAGGTVVLPLVRAPWLAALAVSTQGLCMGVLDTGGNVLLIWLHGSGRVEPYMQAMHFFFGLGAFVAPLLIEASIVQTGNFAAAFYLIGICLVVCSIPLACFRGPIKPVAEQRSDSAAPDMVSIELPSVTDQHGKASESESPSDRREAGLDGSRARPDCSVAVESAVAASSSPDHRRTVRLSFVVLCGIVVHLALVQPSGHAIPAPLLTRRVRSHRVDSFSSTWVRRSPLVGTSSPTASVSST